MYAVVGVKTGHHYRAVTLSRMFGRTGDPNIPRIFVRYLELWFPRIFRISPKYLGGSGMFRLSSGNLNLQNQFELSRNEVHRAIHPNIPNVPANISQISGDIQLNGPWNLVNIQTIIGIFGLIPLWLSLPIV